MARRVERKLAAILTADVVGYSRLMGADEAGTHARLRTRRKELIEPLVAEYRGRVVKLTGDGALVEFASAVDAVECAVAIQRGMAEREAAAPDDRRIVFRIGINLGDIILEDGDIYGEGVNVAARLEGLAEPGGICLAGSVYNQVKGKLDVTLVASGRHQVKNIAEPVETFRVALDGVTAASAVSRARAAGWPKMRWAVPALSLALAVFALAVFALGGAWQFWPSAPPTEGRPGIAVLPFDNFGGDQATGRLADGITEDIITDLARFHDLDVIARNSTEVYKGKPVDVRQVGKDLNVGYVLEGSIQRQNDNVRVTGQLIDARTGAHVWSERWDRPTKDVFAVQTEVAEKVAAALGGNLTMGQISRAELQRAKRLRPNDLAAYDYFQLGKEAKATFSNLDQGIEYLTKAIALDPQLARAYSVRAWLYYFKIMFGADAATGLKQMVVDAEKAVQLDPQDCESLGTLAFARLFQSRWAEAESQFRASVEMCPANSHVLILAASGFSYLGKAEEGASFADRSLRLDPQMTPANLMGVKDAYYMAQRYQDVVAVVDRMPEDSRSRDSWVFLTASESRLGRIEDANAARVRLLQAFPDVSAERMLNEDYAFARKEDEDLFVDGFRVAGLPVCMTAEEIAKFPTPKPRPECLAERAKSLAVKS
jgi:TolB-like protein/class 3 adenylate cyclase/tetratricopeptide (TPR) repeat protein